MKTNGTINIEVGATELCILHTALQCLVFDKHVASKVRDAAEAQLQRLTAIVSQCDILSDREKAGLIREADNVIKRVHSPVILQ